MKALGTHIAGQMDGKIADANATHRNSMIAIIGCIVLLSLVAAALAIVISRRHRPAGQGRARHPGRCPRRPQRQHPGHQQGRSRQDAGRHRRHDRDAAPLQRADPADGTDACRPGHQPPHSEDFPGVYGQLASGINTVIFEHLDAIRDAIDVLNQYAIGNLSPDARRLPGSRAILHESMDAAKASLLAINTQIQQLAAAAAAGDFSQRGDAQRFPAFHALMIEQLNA
jgi:methyl-accepting chemotaxis protein